MRLSAVKIHKAIKISVCLVGVISSILFLAFYCAGQDISQNISRIKQEGTEYAFRARIVEKTGDAVNRGLVVEKSPTTDVKEMRMLVLVTKDTKIGYQIHGTQPRWQDIPFNDLKEETHIRILGLKVTEKAGDQEIIVVLATLIGPTE
jgi:hypothetical protein